MQTRFLAGAGAADITPKNSQFLYGYPHIERYSSGAYDPLLSSALYLCDGTTRVMFIANDIICVSKETTRNVRKRISEKISIPVESIMITATHTHSGPITVNYLSNENDKAVPKADAGYVKLLEAGIVEAAVKAYENSQPTKIGLAIANAKGIGTNRREPSGPADMDVPVLAVKSLKNDNYIACMLICSMHPTVLHENSTLISGDFPGMCREYLQSKVLSKNCAVLHHTGPAGNQSPRYVTNANNIDEAKRIGVILGKAVEKVLVDINYTSNTRIKYLTSSIDLPKRSFSCVSDAKIKLDKAISKLKKLQKNNVNPKETRTAECDWFGAEETYSLAKAFANGRVNQFYKTILPAEIQVIKIGDWCFIGWQGEIFVEYSIAVKKRFNNTFVISLANGELQGYIVTKQAFEECGY
ncbi:MAG: neutral/alkaline non-lysosomal ceramidase N-terminal domain-containing protein, partial [Planctomycetota bacterium]